MSSINKTYTLRFVKLPPATIMLGKPFDIIFSLTDDLGLEVPYFPDVKVAFRVESPSSEDPATEYVAVDTATNATCTVINSYSGTLHRRSLQIHGRDAAIDAETRGIYLVLKLDEQLEEPVLAPLDPIDRGLMEFVHTQALLRLPEDDIVALVVPTYAGPLALQSSKKGNHSAARVHTTEVYLGCNKSLRIVERPMAKIIGDHLWHGSVILAYAILQRTLPLPDARTVIELGAGCGLASLAVQQALAKTGTVILATDLPEVVDSTLTETLEAQKDSNLSIRCASLVWDNIDDTKRLLASASDRQGLWLIAADVLYNPSSHSAFLQTMCDLCEQFERRTVTIAYRPRTSGDDAFFNIASDRGFPFTMAQSLGDVQIWQHSNMEVS